MGTCVSLICNMCARANAATRLYVCACALLQAAVVQAPGRELLILPPEDAGAIGTQVLWVDWPVASPCPTATGQAGHAHPASLESGHSLGHARVFVADRAAQRWTSVGQLSSPGIGGTVERCVICSQHATSCAVALLLVSCSL